MRGGAREKRKIRRGDQALLQAIWNMHGGPTEIARKINAYSHNSISPQAPVNWRLRGKVPYKFVSVVAKVLNISPLGLNYSTLYHLSEDIPSWEDVVKSYGLPAAVVDMILFLKPPTSERR